MHLLTGMDYVKMTFLCIKTDCLVIKFLKSWKKKKKKPLFFFFYHLPNELTAVFIHKLFLTPTVCKSAAESLVYKGGGDALSRPLLSMSSLKSWASSR